MTAGAAPPFRADRIGSLRRPAELEDDQRRKLALGVEVAREVWGTAA